MDLRLKAILSIVILLVFMISIVQVSSAYELKDNDSTKNIKSVSASDEDDNGTKKKRSHSRRRKVKPIKDNTKDNK